MKKVAVFGNAGGGKSTLARKLAELTGLPLYPLDIVKYRAGTCQPGSEIPQDEYRALHADLLNRDQWIIDGFDTTPLTWERFAAADTLIHVDLPLATHFGLVTARFAQGLFSDPKGWPKNSPLWSSTLSSYRVLWPCHRHLTPKYRQFTAEAANTKRVHHLKSLAEIKLFLQAVAREHQRI